jgi:hypothetical protein
VTSPQEEEVMATSDLGDEGREPGDVGDDADALPDAASTDDLPLGVEVDRDDLALGETPEVAKTPENE